MDEIIGDSMEPEFAFDYLRGEAPQVVHGQGSFDLAVMQFDLPAPSIELSNGRVWIGCGVEQRGGDDDVSYPEATGVHRKAHQPHGQFFGQSLPPPAGQTSRLVLRARPVFLPTAYPA